MTVTRKTLIRTIMFAVVIAACSKSGPAHLNPSASAEDESAIREIPERMIGAWNRGSGDGFAEPFAEDGHQIAFEGTKLKSRKEIADFHNEIFGTVMKGSRLEGGADRVRFMTSDVAVMMAWADTTMPGETTPLESRNSMQMFVVQRENGRWQTKEVLNARKIALERQQFLDTYDSLTPGGKERVNELVNSLKKAAP